MLRLLLKQSEKEGLLQERQDMFDSLNASKTCIRLILEEDEQTKEYFYHLLKFTILLLKNGNLRTQKTIYNFFVSNPSSEKFFQKAHSQLMIQSEMS